LREGSGEVDDAMVNRARHATLGAAIAFAIASFSCSNKPGSAPSPSATTAASAAQTATPEEPPGDAEKGKALVAKYECSRCHEGTGTPTGTIEKQCFGCHVKIIDGTFKGPKGAEARWFGRVIDLKDVPTLTASQQRFRRTWLVNFLTNPHDLRPRLGPTMPRLPLTREEARDIAAYLADADDPAKRPDWKTADPARGRGLMEAKGCPSCHVFTGVPPLAGAAPVKADDTKISAGLALAPDLRFARERLKPEAVIAWVTNPKAVKKDTEMPEFNLAPDEARDIAAYILTTPLAAPEPPKTPARLPPLERKVTYDEVSAKVFRRTCWHCHGEPDYAAGDGGPGNTGGFGFKPRGINFVDYGSVQAGRVDDKGERHSLFEKAADGTPRLLKALLARRDEEAGHPDPEIRGMPLGYPALSPEDIQLVETWIVQGRPR
jgi:cytochrome c1